MKVTVKLVGYLVLGIFFLLATDLYLAVLRESNVLHADMDNDARLFGTALQEWVTETWRTHGEEAAMRMIEEMNRESNNFRVRWIWLNDSPGKLHRPKVPHEILQQFLAQDTFSWQQADEDGNMRLYTYVVQMTGDAEKDRRRGALEISQPFDFIQLYTASSIKRRLVVMGLIVLLATLTAGLLGMTIIGKPLQQLAEKAKRIGEGAFDEPVEIRGNDELTALGSALNLMSQQLYESKTTLQKEHKQRIAMIEQLRHADRLRTVGELSSGLAHELGTPLNVISGRAGLIASEKLSHEETIESAKIIRGQAERMTKIIQQLLDYARRRKPKHEPYNLRAIAQQTIDLMAPMATKKGVSLQLLDGKDCVAMVDIGQIQQVLTNLIVNALHVAPPQSSVEVQVTQTIARPPGDSTAEEKEYACLVVSDSGEGIPPEHMDRLFEPFFTTKESGEGCGLGLSVVQGIVQEHRGWIDVESQTGRGTHFRVYLPMETTSCQEKS